ncbi:MAG: hypothetical protein WDA65_05030 [Christensenellales bacterium]
MKKIVLIFIMLIVLLAFAACAGEPDANQEDAADTPAAPELTSSPTPKPTLSKEDIENRERYDMLISIAERYNDWSAALLVREMHSDGKITESQYLKLFSIEAFKDAKNYNDGIWDKLKDQLNGVANVINGNSKDMDKDEFNNYLCTAARHRTVYITLFDSQEKRERVIRGISNIDEWFDEPTDDKFNAFTELYFSDGLTPGEVILLNCYLRHHPNSPAEVGGKTTSKYFTSKGIQEYADSALGELYD